MPTRPPVVTPPQSDNGDLDLLPLLGTLVDHKWLIAAVVALAFMLSAGYALLARPVYEANALVQVEPKTAPLPGLNAVSELLAESTPQAVTEIALIRSRSILGAAVAELRLDIQARPARFPLLGNLLARRYVPAAPGAVASAPLGLSRYGWGGERLDIESLELPDALLGKPLQLIAGDDGSYALRSPEGEPLLEGKTGAPAEGAGASIEVAALHANPGTRFELVKQPRLSAISTLQAGLAVAEQAKDSGIISLSYQLEEPARAVAILDTIVDLYARQNVERNSAEAATSLAFVNRQLPQVRRDLEAAEEALNAYRSRTQSVDIGLETQAILDQLVATEANLSNLRLQQAEVDRRFTREHPARRALMRQIGELEGTRDELTRKIEGLPETHQELLRLTRDVEVGTLTYTNLLNQAQQLDIARAGTVGNARVIDAAAVDTARPVKPRKARIVMLGTFLGGFAVVAWVLLRHLLNRGVEDPQAIEQLGLPVYASIPLSPFQRDHESIGRHRPKGAREPHLLALDAPADLAIEALRSLRTSLHFGMLEARNNVLMIAGSSPDAGKTFVATNLAAVLAQAGQRVLLIDGDLRRGTLHRVMGFEPGNGLSDVLAGRLDAAGAIRHSAVEGLHFVSRGQVPPNPSELLMHPGFGALLEQVSTGYDLVVMDTPPILAVTDAAIIGRHAGTSLLVARFGFNRPRELELARQRLEQNGIELKGAIFNAVEKRTEGYYAYAYYDYRPERT
ncbi:polysaccharide biosynthesis tyrosine autokinase [Luteimonas salinisoli]|nr:polysaccharide biosynthesis tyrosine autokinase [Luteimonas salinisoli]